MTKAHVLALLLALLLSLPLWASSVSAPEMRITVKQPGSVSVAWDPNPEPNIGGYLIEYQKVGSEELTQVDVKNVTQFTVTGLEIGKDYRFRAYAYNTEGERSEPSLWVSTELPPPPPPPPQSCKPLGAPGAAPEVVVIVQSFDENAARSDPKGILVRFDASSSEPITRVEFDLEGDEEPAVPLIFPVGVGFDGRFVRAIAFKATRNGTWPLIVEATDQAGRKNATRCTPGITVGF